MNNFEKSIINNSHIVGELPFKFKKYAKLNELKKYDKSINVNSFTFNGIGTWIDRDTRVSLVNSTNARLKNNQTTTALWLNGIRLELNCEMLLNLLNQLEIYALECYDITEGHKAAIEAIENLEELEAYNFKVGYPEKLNITLN